MSKLYKEAAVANFKASAHILLEEARKIPQKIYYDDLLSGSSTELRHAKVTTLAHLSHLRE
jgi:hypothetical protein